MPSKANLIGCVLAALLAVSASAAESRPNVLFIAIDDLRPELGAYGAEHISSPHIDRLAAQSVRFDAAYVQQAVCGPSRVSMLTGYRPHTSGITENRVKIRDPLPDVVTLPQHFKNNGYHAVNIGKVFHGHDGTYNDIRSWSEPWYNAPPMYTGNIRGYLSYENLKILAERNLASDRRQNSARFWEMEDVPDNAYPDGMVAEKAVDTLYRLKDLGKPFFLAVGIEKPHLPFAAPRKYWDLYDRDEIGLPDNYFPTQGETPYTTAHWADMVNYVDSPSPETITDETAKLIRHGYYACVSYADALVGQLLDGLREAGLAEDTIIVLWGDHGWKLGEHFMWSKSTNYELDARAPLLVFYPGMKNAGKATAALVESVDLYPTLCDLAGLPKPDHLQGDSFAPLLEDLDRPWKRAAFSQYPREGGAVMGFSMKTRDFRYTRWEDASTGEILARELYDHRIDYAENFNIAERPDSKSAIERLDRLFAAEFERTHRQGEKPLRLPRPAADQAKGGLPRP